MSWYQRRNQKFQNTPTDEQRFQSIFETILSCCLKCWKKKKTESNNPNVSKTKKEKNHFIKKCSEW